MQNKVRIVKDGQTIDLDNLISSSASKPINAIKVNYGNGQSAFVYNTYEVPLHCISSGNQVIVNTGDRYYYNEDSLYVNVSDLPNTAEKRAQTYISIPAGTITLVLHYNRTIGTDGELPLRLWYKGGKIPIPTTIPSGATRLYLVPDFGSNNTAWTFTTNGGHYFNYTLTSSIGVKFEPHNIASDTTPVILIPLALTEDFLLKAHSGVTESNTGPKDSYIVNTNYYRIEHWGFNTTSSGTSNFNTYSPSPARAVGEPQPYDLYIAHDKVKTYYSFKDSIAAKVNLPSGEYSYPGYPAYITNSDYSYSVCRESSKIEGTVGPFAVLNKNDKIYVGDVLKVSAQVFDTTNFKVSSLTGSPTAIDYSINTDAQKVGTITISQNQGISCTIQRITKSATTTVNLGKPSYDSENDKYYLDKTVSFPGGSNTYITKITIDSITPSDITISSPSISGSNRTIRFYNSSINPSHAGDDIIVTYTYKYYTATS